MTNIRKAAVAGTFYPAEPTQLKQMIEQYIKEVPSGHKVPKAIIAPHAGYIYSGPIAASVYARLLSAKNDIKRVVLIGPSHCVGFYGLAVSAAKQFATPLGNIEVDVDAILQIAALPFVQYMEQAHEREHSLEVHLPFLQTVLNDFTLIPIVAGDAPAEQTCQILEMFWDQPETLLLISSDLSHFHDYETAKKLDRETSQIIENLQYEQLGSGSACGRVPVSGLLALARKKGLQVKAVDIRNSGDTAGYNDKNRVVGYGAYVVE